MPATRERTTGTADYYRHMAQRAHVTAMEVAESYVRDEFLKVEREWLALAEQSERLSGNGLANQDGSQSKPTSCF